VFGLRPFDLELKGLYWIVRKGKKNQALLSLYHVSPAQLLRQSPRWHK